MPGKGASAQPAPTHTPPPLQGPLSGVVWSHLLGVWWRPEAETLQVGLPGLTQLPADGQKGMDIWEAEQLSCPPPPGGARGSERPSRPTSVNLD